MITDSVKNYVYGACQESQNVFGSCFFEQHILVVLEYANKLAEKIGGNKEIIELSVLFHDISAVLDSNTLPTHSLASQDIAQVLLAKQHYPQDKIDIVKKCIATHSTPVQINEGLVEEVCLSNADAISQIVKPAYWLYFAYHVRKLNYETGKEFLINRIDTNWEKIIDPARELIEDQYQMVRKLLTQDK